MAQLKRKLFIKLRSRIAILALVLTLVSCDQHSINIKTYKLSKHDISDMGPCFYFDSSDSIKDGFLFFGDVGDCCFMTINNKRNILLHDDNTTIADPLYLSVVEFKNKDYKIVLKLNWADITKKFFLKGIMIVQNTKGDSVVRRIEGRF